MRLRLHTKLLLLALALGAIAWAIGEPPVIADDDPVADAESDAAARKILIDRLWVQRVPRSERDLVPSLVFVDRDGARLGSGGVFSRWRTVMDVFRWKLKGSQLDLELPQEQKRVRLKARARKCKAPAPFTLCLDLERGGNRATYYSSKELALPREGSLTTAWGAVPLPVDPAPAACDDCVFGLPTFLDDAGL